MAHNPTFLDLRGTLPVADFWRIEKLLKCPEVKTYQRVVTDVVLKTVGAGQVGLVKYEPDDAAKYDPGEIKTAWVDDTLALYVLNLAKSFKGKGCLLFQRNIDKSEDQPTGYRELIWIQMVEE